MQLFQLFFRQFSSILYVDNIFQVSSKLVEPFWRKTPDKVSEKWTFRNYYIDIIIFHSYFFLFSGTFIGALSSIFFVMNKFFLFKTERHFLYETERHILLGTEGHFLYETERHFLYETERHFLYETERHLYV